MKIKRIACFIMAFAVILGTLSMAAAAATSFSYSISNCTHSFITSNKAGSNNNPVYYYGIYDTCTYADYVNNTADYDYHYSRVVKDKVNDNDPYETIGPYVPVHENLPYLVPVTHTDVLYGAIRLKIQNTYSHFNNSPSSHKMSTGGSFYSTGPTMN